LFFTRITGVALTVVRKDGANKMNKIAIIMCFVGILFSQRITNVIQLIENGRVVIYYDLSGDRGETYDISVTASRESGPLFFWSDETDGGTIIPRTIVGRLDSEFDSK